jgi:hypothetical protein
LPIVGCTRSEHLLGVVGDQLVEERFVDVLQQVDMPGQIVVVAGERLVGTLRLLASVSMVGAVARQAQ